MATFKASEMTEPWAKRLLPDTEVTMVGHCPVFVSYDHPQMAEAWYAWSPFPNSAVLARVEVFRTREEAIRWASVEAVKGIRKGQVWREDDGYLVRVTYVVTPEDMEERGYAVPWVWVRCANGRGNTRQVDPGWFSLYTLVTDVTAAS